MKLLLFVTLLRKERKRQQRTMSHNTAEAEKMVEAWKASGMQFTVGYQNRFRPEVQKPACSLRKG